METYREPNSEKIKQMFAEIAPSYDVANSVLSLGIHHLWKKKLVNLSGAKPGDSVLDTATGTGDLAIQFKKTVGDTGTVIATDFCEEILSHGPAKAAKAGLNITFKTADVTNLQFADQSFDIASISFGIRNVNNLSKAITELARVTKPGGRVMILEFGQMQIPVVKQTYNFYAKYLLPKIGGLISGKQAAYQYLNDSSQVFPSGESFKKLLIESGMFSRISVYPLMGGLAYIYKSEKN